ncbi:hypothetical protein L3X38_032743 [Prunus dulcis]|uniref:Uncharacterized protein n=1 Tax=Prunus dulcis TaxID=3755 RepID=A0AAD4VGT2_PRUDU|nr:hypothetical protein L3X38_032743 [Prunus dulcis]
MLVVVAAAMATTRITPVKAVVLSEEATVATLIAPVVKSIMLVAKAAATKTALITLLKDAISAGAMVVTRTITLVKDVLEISVDTDMDGSRNLHSVTELPSVSWTPFVDWVPNWSKLLSVLGVGFSAGMGLRSLLDLGCPTCVNAGLLFTLLHIANLTSLLSSLREILENSYCLSKRGVAVHPKVS